LAVHGIRNAAGFDFRGITTDAALQFPIIRHYLTWIGVIAATAKNVKKHVSLFACFVWRKSMMMMMIMMMMPSLVLPG